VLVTRVRGYGGVLRLPREVSADSGLLHVLGFRHRARTAWLGLGLCGMTFGLRAGRNLVVRSTTAVQVDGEAPFQLDGDFAGSGPQRIGLEDAHAHILAPAR
jgi:hypothetical protein